MCSSEDSFEGVAATFKWLEYKDWERLDLFDTHEHDGLIAQTMRRKANLVFRCFVLIVRHFGHLAKQEVPPRGQE